MIYAYDKNIQLPVKDLYDDKMMAMAILAAKDQYDEAQKRMDDFYDKYGDFYSPFKKDQEWYDENVINRFNREIQDMYDRGDDPLRSVKGRADLAKLVRQTPMGTINAMKRNAKTGERYQQNAASLKAQGKYNPDMAAQQDGVFSDFSTVGDNGEINTWEKESPTPYQNIDELLEPIIKNVKPIYDEEKSKLDPSKIWKTITLPRLMQAFDDNMSDILATPSGQYLLYQSQQEADYLNKINPNGNVTALDVLKEKAKNRLSDHIYEDWTYDPIYLKRLEHQYKLSEAKYAHDLDKPDETKNPLQFSQRIQLNIDDKHNKNIRKAAIDYAKASLRNAEAFENKTKNNKNIKGAKYGSAFWKQAIKDLQNEDGYSDALVKYGLADDHGNPAKKLTSYVLQQHKKNNNGFSYWNGRSYTPASDYEKEVTRNLFSGSDRVVDIMGGKYNTISLGDAGIKYAPYRYSEIVGREGKNKKESKLSRIQKEFQSWLNGSDVQGYVDNSAVDIALIPTANGNNITDLRGKVLIQSEDFDKFVNILRGEDSDISKEEIISNLKIRKRTDRSNRDSARPKDRDYYIVPIIRSTDITMDDINQQYNHAVYGGTSASAERDIATEEGLDWYFNN